MLAVTGLTACSSSLPQAPLLGDLDKSLIILSGQAPSDQSETEPKPEQDQAAGEQIAKTPQARSKAQAKQTALVGKYERQKALEAATAISSQEQELAGCPFVDIPRGAEVYQMFTKGNSGNQVELIYQAAINDTSSRCVRLPNGDLQLKIGIEGRLIQGPRGKHPFKVRFPLAVVVREIEGMPIYDKIYQVSLSLDQGQSAKRFTEIYDKVIIKSRPGKLYQVNDIRIEAGFPPPAE